jgi:AcrR family transcriptional regulator
MRKNSQNRKEVGTNGLTSPSNNIMANQDEHLGKRKVLPPDERREMILDAALEVFAQGGFQDADVDEIAQVAQVGKGTIYRYYASKNELYHAVVERVFSQLHDRIQSSSRNSSSPDDLILSGLTAHVEFFTENPRRWRVLMIGRKEDHLVPACDSLLAHHAIKENIRVMITEGVADGYFRQIDPEFASYALMSLAATIVEKHFHQKTDTRQEDIRSALDIYLRGIRK